MSSTNEVSNDSINDNKQEVDKETEYLFAFNLYFI